MRKGETQVFITLGFLGLLFLMPLSGNGADLTISNVITGNGNMTLNGAMNATSFSGSGSGLTNLDPIRLSSGTANINISGNAATVTNGLYSSGSYANPSWITSLSPGKLTSGKANINISGNAATATTAITAATANSVAPGGVVTTGLADGAVTAGKLAANAVTPAAIAFYGNVAVVAPSGGDYTNPATAMAEYSLWCGTPSETNPCLLKIMPGVYTVTSPVEMQPYIDIEGSGENTTVIQGNFDGGANTACVVEADGADCAEIRFLTVKYTGGGLSGAAIRVSSVSSKITNVTATASGGSESNFGIITSLSYGMTMTNVIAHALGPGDSFGVFGQFGSYAMTNVYAVASGASNINIGVNNHSTITTMTNVTANASGGTDNRGVYNIYSTLTMMNVIATASEGLGDNYGVWNNVSSDKMINVMATGSGGSGNSYGVYNDSSSPIMTNLTLSAIGGANSYGVYNISSQPIMRDVLTSATSASGINAAIRNDNNSYPILINVTANANAMGTGTYAFGLFNIDTAGPVDVNRSTFSALGGTGQTTGIRNDSNSFIRVGASKIAGSTAGKVKCAGVYDDNYNFYPSSCP